MPKLFAIIALIKNAPRLIRLWSTKSVNDIEWGQCIGEVMRSLITLGILKPDSKSVTENESTVKHASSSVYPAMDGQGIAKKKLINPRESGSKI